MGTFNWPPAGTCTWPHMGTFSWPRTRPPACTARRSWTALVMTRPLRWLGLAVDPSTVRGILKGAGFNPAPRQDGLGGFPAISGAGNPRSGLLHRRPSQWHQGAHVLAAGSSLLSCLLAMSPQSLASCVARTRAAATPLVRSCRLPAVLQGSPSQTLAANASCRCSTAGVDTERLAS
jgi:hypothetical protein